MTTLDLKLGHCLMVHYGPSAFVSVSRALVPARVPLQTAEIIKAFYGKLLGQLMAQLPQIWLEMMERRGRANYVQDVCGTNWAD